MKILLVWIAQFVGHNGGMDKVFVNFANEMTIRGHEVTLLYCTEHTGRIYTPIHPNVRVKNLVHWLKGEKYESLPKSRMFKIKREIFRIFRYSAMNDLKMETRLRQLGGGASRFLREERPDIIIEMDAITSGIFREPAEEIGCPVIVMSHFDAGTIIKNLSKEERMALDASDIVQVLMPSDMTAFRKVLTKAKLIRIANIVPQYEQTEGHAKRKESLLIDVARLDKKPKRQHLLIKAFAEIAPEFPKWKLELWGEEQGSEKPYTKELEDLLHKYHLEGQVKLCGNTDDVLSVYRRASIFAFPSAFEGFPLAMTEAMSAGLPVVAYRSCPAVNELVEDGKTGLLVEDGVDALAEGLRKLMNDQAMREEMGRAAHEAMKAYAPEKIWDQWEELMKDVVANHASRK